ncbi:hypothetical protein H6P81_016808 [Aristolochia fimbriata]|uniref:BTB/POZ domain-containing protein n=1 Tax=Aristolochia fimbriata TaxID=158543 RepID=A0AAV7E9R9_ARIFI|nr:hypothetical protein H6P81_016808 [Aristolochia fimbriata]
MENGDSLPAAAAAGGRVRLNVGGKLFETTVSTLQTAGPDSLLAALATRSSNRNDDDEEGEGGEPVFIDRDPEIFSIFLSLLRSGRLPSTARRFSSQELADEALYYGVEGQLRAAMSPPPFSGIDASVIATVRPASDAVPTAFSAGAGDGSVWIAHGGQISCYDWGLAHVGTIRTHLDAVTSLRRVWSDVAAIGSETSPGVHFYDAASARRVGSVHWSDPSDPRVYKARVAAMADSGDSVFASFECRHRENCVLVIDKSSLRSGSEIGRNSGNSAKSLVPTKLKFIPENNLLFGSSVTSGAFGCSGYIRLWDVRSGDMVWETNEPGSGRSSRFGDSFADADVDPEESKIFKVCSKSGDVGFADLRRLGDDPWVYLEEKNPSLRNTGTGGGGGGSGNNITTLLIHCYRKQVFVGREGALEVWSPVKGGEESSVCENSYTHRRNYVDKEEGTSSRGIISRMEGGGERLFVSREDVEGIEVWESSNFAGAIPVS